MAEEKKKHPNPLIILMKSKKVVDCNNKLNIDN